MKMFVAVGVLMLIVVLQGNFVYARVCERKDKGISEKEWKTGTGRRNEEARIFPNVVDASGDECKHGFLDIGTDKVLVYNLSSWYDKLGDNFDANQIVIYAHQERLDVLAKLKEAYGDSDGKPYHNQGSGENYCNGQVRICVGSSVSSDVSELRDIFLWNKSFPKINITGNNFGVDNPQIFTQGNHTHIIAPDYRCSKETNGPILCWESGGDTNCWDAWKWYQFNGDVYEVAEHRNDSNWITTLDRDYTCSQVYSGNPNESIGGDAGSQREGTGSGYNNDQGDDPWAGYDHDVGLKYLRIGNKSSDRWKGSKVWSINQIPAKQDFRVKLKRKGGRWKDVCAEVWFSHNKYFTSDDKYLGKECKRLSKKKYRKKKMTIKI